MCTNSIYMFTEASNLPREGWLQCCLCCDAVTGNTYNFVIGYLCMYNVSAYICEKCIVSKKNRSIVMKEAPNFIRRLSNRNRYQIFQ